MGRKGRAFWGAYAMLIFAMIAYALPEMTGRKLYGHWANEWAFWVSNIGMVSMTGAFAVAGITQVHLERRVGMDFLDVQEAVQVHFLGLVLAACLFTIGIGLYIWQFSKYGHPLKMDVQDRGGSLDGAVEGAVPDAPSVA